MWFYFHQKAPFSLKKSEPKNSKYFLLHFLMKIRLRQNSQNSHTFTNGIITDEGIMYALYVHAFQY